MKEQINLKNDRLKSDCESEIGIVWKKKSERMRREGQEGREIRIQKEGGRKRMEGNEKVSNEERS